MRFAHTSVLAVTLTGVAVLVGGQACSSAGEDEEIDPPFDAGGDVSDSGLTDGTPCLGACDASDAGCVGLECKVNKSCPDGKHTTLTGKVFDPRGSNPIYNAIVYVPRSESLPPITPGVTQCASCDTKIQDVLAATRTDETGTFVLEDVPTGKNIPVVVQVGKWRRKFTVASTKDCDTTVVPDGDAHLPRNQTEGDLPQMALLLGGADQLGCLIRRLGIDDEEFTGPSGTGRIHVYKGMGGGNVSGGIAGDCRDSSCPLWQSADALRAYDMVFLTCEGAEHGETKPPAATNAMRDYLNSGGKMFGTHYHYYWLKNGPSPFDQLATWGGPASTPFTIDTSFEKGKALRDWLQNVGAIGGGTTIPLVETRESVGKISKDAVRWIYSGTSGGDDESVKYFSFNTPIGGIPTPDGGVAYCGKGVFSDIHVSSGQDASSVPLSCGDEELTAQEKVLEFLLFDLSACVTDDTKPPPDPW